MAGSRTGQNWHLLAFDQFLVRVTHEVWIWVHGAANPLNLLMRDDAICSKANISSVTAANCWPRLSLFKSRVYESGSDSLSWLGYNCVVSWTWAGQWKLWFHQVYTWNELSVRVITELCFQWVNLTQSRKLLLVHFTSNEASDQRSLISCTSHT